MRKYIHLLQSNKNSKVYSVEDLDGTLYVMKIIKNPSTLVEIEVPYKLKRLTPWVMVPYRVNFKKDKLVIYSSYMENKDLTHNVTSMSCQSKLRALLNVAEVIQCMHSKLKCMHNDIKPENIFIDRYKNAKLGDFGLCRYKVQNCTALMGTSRYMSPEKLSSSYDYRSDIWSFGVTAYYCFTNGALPFRISDNCEDARKVNWTMHTDPLKVVFDQDLRELIVEMLTYDISRRLTNLSEIIERLKMVYKKFENYVS
ncbi:cAMP-dependent protein kinase catalytic chain 1 [Heliothis zea nudivirus]|uniref:non-specific serine/threonine protein kinase n=2 Tax=Betanudivirus hezeae TaxID=3052000 RepID=G9I0D6_HZNV2|nr:cAMP-dependent protein kinase catalytic chain 1 [Heliothis zea nudivirus]YP_004956858.1 orf110 gene product [Helicoverpa zea nudivirus 2]AAM45756.1 cAMP-dependent protein kinase catalytic chain 1 [Heliothis zea nudivirus]AEW69659.1 protein kinase [Helicoverpa zea nudivirus 2]WCZ68587.1 protein kinase [Heliothis virescens nudivirus]